MPQLSPFHSDQAGVVESAPDDALDLNAALRASLRGEARKLDAHLICLERDIEVGKTRTKLHCYFLPLDGNGRVRMQPLAEFLRDQVIDYAIPRHTIAEANKQFERTGSMAAISNLHERAKRLFTHLERSGEGGELLLFAMAEAVFGITQIICKMSLKTSPRLHYHGADGVYAEARDDGGINLYWGESKIYKDAKAAIRNCLESLAPFLREPEGEDAERDQDLLLVNEFANFTDERLVEALRQFLDRDNPSSLQVRHCGFALAGFDCTSYPGDDVEGNTDVIASAIRDSLEGWVDTTNQRVCQEKLVNFDIHFICIPLPSADQFRTYFLRLLGVEK